MSWTEIKHFTLPSDGAMENVMNVIQFVIYDYLVVCVTDMAHFGFL